MATQSRKLPDECDWGHTLLKTWVLRVVCPTISEVTYYRSTWTVSREHNNCEGEDRKAGNVSNHLADRGSVLSAMRTPVLERTFTVLLCRQWTLWEIMTYPTYHFSISIINIYSKKKQLNDTLLKLGNIDIWKSYQYLFSNCKLTRGRRVRWIVGELHKHVQTLQ